MKKPPPPPHRPPPPRARNDDDDETVVIGGTGSDAVTAAMHAVIRSPENDALWDELETLGRAAGRTDDVAATYRAVLMRPRLADVALRLGARAIAFHDEWAPDDDGVRLLLERLAEADPQAPWVLSRLSMVYAQAERWDELLALYDRAIAAATLPDRRAALLEEAARVAKDCAGQSERAIGYMGKLFALRPGDTRGAATLERLLKQQRRWRELVDLWTAQLERMPVKERVAQRARIASTWLSQLHEPAAALSAIEPLLDEDAAPLVLPVLFGIVSAPSASVELRERAYALLMARAQGPALAATRISASRAMLGFAEDRGRPALHTDLAAALLREGDHAGALEHVGALLVVDPETWGPEAVAALVEGRATSVGGETFVAGAEAGRKLVHVAASRASNETASAARAIALYRALLAAGAADAVAIDALAALYEASGSATDLLSLRRHQLELATDVATRVALRLAMAALLATTGEHEPRATLLTQNLAESPGHADTIEALASALRDAGREGDLAAILETEAGLLDGLGNAAEAARLWARAAEIAGDVLGDVERAATLLERSAERAASPAVLDALARIDRDRGRTSRVVDWLTRRLSIALPGETGDVALQLAEAHVAEGQPAHARTVLDAAQRNQPERADLLDRLVSLLREGRAYPELVEVLLRGAEHAPDVALRVRHRVEASFVLSEEMSDPARAAEVLEPALALSPDDGVLRSALARALRRSNRLPEARELLVDIVESYGKRRPRDRAEAHFELASVNAALSRHDEALAELETAVAIDPEHLRAQKLLGDLALAGGHLERADRAYTSVMLVLARGAEAHHHGAPSMAAVLFDLYRVASRRGLPRAAENLASALEIAETDESEARVLESLFAAAEEHELLLRALEQRLARAETARDRGETQRRIAETLGRAGDDPRALTAWLATLDHLPDDAAAHASTASLASREGQPQAYVSKVEELVTRARDDADLARLSGLLLHLAKVRETAGDLDGAATLLTQAEDTGERLPEVWRASARIARARGETALALAALRRLDAGDLPEGERASLLLTIAELEMDVDRSLSLGTLERALEAGLPAADARPLLERACDDPSLAPRAIESLLSLARTNGDPAAILDALCRAASLTSVDGELVREALSLAEKLGDPRELSLLTRAATLPDGEIAAGALRTLAERARARGDLREAVLRYGEAAKVAPPHESRELGRAAADLLGGALGDLPAAVDAYQALFDEDPSDAPVGTALLDAARRLDDPARLDRVLAGVIDTAYDARERNALRMERAELLRAGGQTDEAMDLLSAVLFDEADHPGAAALLARLLAAAGRHEELADLYTRQIDLARDRADAPAIENLSLRLAGTLREQKPDQAIVVLRDAMTIAGPTRRLLRALIGVLPQGDPEKPELMERLLAAEATAGGVPAERVTLALSLADVRLAMGDASGAERALLLAHALDGESADVRARLLSLGDDLVRATEGIGRGSLILEGDTRALTRAARIFRALGDQPRTASTLRQAHALDPSDGEAGLALARVLFDLGDDQDALDVLDKIPDHPESRRGALRLRADVRSRQGRHGDAVMALESARDGGDPSAEDALVSELRAARRQGLDASDIPLARSYTAKLVPFLSSRGGSEEAIALLEEILSHVEGDDTAVVALEIDAIARTLDQPDLARRPLEMALETRPTSAPVRARLRQLYDAAGASRELSSLLVLEARHATDPAARFAALREVGRLRLEVLGEAAAAIGPLSDARALRPQDQEVTLMLSSALVAASMHDDAAQLLREAIKLHGGKRSRALALLQRRIAEVHASQGDRAGELGWLLAAFESHPQSGEIAKALADAALARGDDEAASRALRAITLMREAAPMPRAEAYAHLAQIAARQGDSRKAVTLARKALSEDPKNEIARAVTASLEAEQGV